MAQILRLSRIKAPRFSSLSMMLIVAFVLLFGIAVNPTGSDSAGFEPRPGGHSGWSVSNHRVGR